MRLPFRSATIARRLNLLTVLFGLGLAVVGGLALNAQWGAMRDQEIAALTMLNHVVVATMEHERLLAAAASLTEEETKRRVLASISAIRYDDGGYFTVLDSSGVILAHPDPSAVSKDFSKLKDANGVFYIADAIARAQRDGSAVLDFLYPRPGQTEPVPKIQVYTAYPRWGWMIATGAWMDTMHAAFWSSSREMIIIAAGILLMVIGIGVLMARSITKPLRGIKLAMDQVAAGHADPALPEVALSGEIGAMARAVLVFRDAGVAKFRLEQDAAESLRLATTARERQTDLEAAAAHQQQAVVQDLADGLTHLADGDLTFRLERGFSAEYEKLREDYNRAMTQMQETILTIVTNVARLRSGSSEISVASDDLSRRTEQQAATLEQTAAALDEITAAVSKTAAGARQARTVVASAQTGAQQSGQVVKDAVTAMSAIASSAEKISQIIGVIDEIAFQTNLLALNAGVEAARAGEAGRGFAVVASEVRALAQRSAEAAKEIKGLISTSSLQVGRGVELVGATGHSLEQIAIQVAELNSVVTEIAASAQEQATGLAEVNTAVNQMDQVTQQNAAMVEQSTAASHSLADDTEQLVHLTERFRLGQANGTAAQSTRPTRRPTKPAPKPAPTTAFKATQQARVGAVRAPALQEDWKEF